VNSSYLRLAVAWFVCLGVGCTSAPVRYYTLAPTPDKTLPASETTLSIDVRVLHIPPQLNHAELMVRAGPSEVTLLENERWASPVADEIKDAVRLELRRRLDDVAGLPLGAKKLIVDIDVQHLDAEPEHYALLEVFWSAASTAGGERSKDALATNCAFQSYEKIRNGYSGMVEGYQREIAALAENIVAVLRSPASGMNARCHKSMEGSAGGSGSISH
jgi:uncharacterized protein